jgi:CBS domain-containing protein
MDVTRFEVPRCRPDERVGAVRTRVRQTGWDRAVVVSVAGVVLGLLSGGALDADAETLVEAVMDPAPKTIRPSVALDGIAEHFPKGAASVLVTTPDGVLLGLVNRADVERRVPQTAA